MKIYTIPVTVILPIYKVRYDLFRKCLESISWQTQIPQFLIIIDDGNNDPIIDKIANSFINENPFISIQYISCDTNNGISVARNIGLRHVKTEWVSFLDADDIIMEDYFEKLFEASQKQHYDIIACSCYAYTGINYNRNHFFSGDHIFCGKEDLETLEKMFMNHTYLREGSLIDSSIGVPWGKLYRFSSIKYGFNPNLKRMEDNLWNHQIVASSPNLVVKYIDKPLYIYNTSHIEQYNHEYEDDISTWIEVVKQREEIVKPHLGTGDEIESFFYEEVLQILMFILQKKYFHKQNTERRKSFIELQETVLKNKTFEMVLKKHCDGTPFYRRLTLKCLLKNKVFMAYIINKIRHK